MIIFLNNIKRILRDRGNFISMLLVPVFFITMVVVFNGKGSSMARVGITDYDQTELTRIFIESLEERSQIYIVEEKEIEKRLINSKIDYGIIIPPGFTRGIMDQRDVKLEGYRILESEVAIPTIFYANNFVDGIKTVAAASRNEAEFYQGVDYYLRGSLKIDHITLEDNSKPRGITLAGMGFLVMSMLFFSSFTANMILEDRKNRILYRVLASPIEVKGYMLENLLSFLCVSQIQIAAVFIMMRVIFNMNLGPSLLNLYIVLSVFSLVCVSFGVALTSLGKDSRQASIMASFLITPMAMLGGSFWPREIMPEFLQKVGYFVPVTWVLKGAEKVLFGGTLLDAKIELLILFLFAVIFFLLGTWRKADISL